jgi:photosystem II stability/assembly factor-like uncharacterized protein
MDNGRNWSTIYRVAWEDAIFNLISEHKGWALVSIGEENSLVLTTDDGKTWILLDPIILAEKKSFSNILFNPTDIDSTIHAGQWERFLTKSLVLPFRP